MSENFQSTSFNALIEEIVYRNPENGYTVFDFSTEDEYCTGVGMLADISEGESVRLTGEWGSHPRYGRQFKVESIERQIPETAGDMLRYLSGGQLKGIGPKTAAKIVERFGDRSFEVIENSPEELSLIKGITYEAAKKIQKEFKKKNAVREVMIALERYGMNATECLAAYGVYESRAIEMISSNPYVLCNERIGISFNRVEEIAQSFNGADFSHFRRRAGIISVIRHNLGNGHTCLPRDKVLVPSAALLDCSEDDINETISDLIIDKELVATWFDEKEFLYIPEIYHAEKNIADRISVMLKFPPAQGSSIDSDIDKIEKDNGISFESKQRLAIKTAIEKGLLVLTGGPGTGKTTTLKGILDLFERKDLKVLLAAPTGRAAKRMSDVTGRDAKTIHRLLEVSFGKNHKQIFNRNMQHPLECDAIVVDELSMVDVQLFWGLLDALPLGCRLIMVGDSDQLPPVGAGNVLKDIIESELMPVVALTEIFRQAGESLIVTNAHRIVRGEHPELGIKDKDFFLLERSSTSEVSSVLKSLYTERLPKAYGYNSVDDIQILCPSRMGELGTIQLNQALQELVNPPQKFKEEYKPGGRIFREGDKVMQIKNNYDLDWISELDGKSGTGVFNGDIGNILTININARYMKIKFDERIVTYPFESLSELELAYAVTVHKSQGCEFECVVMPVFNVVSNLAYRNLIYTAVTRAKTRIILIGRAKDVYAMVDNDKKTRRYSGLEYFLKAES